MRSKPLMTSSRPSLRPWFVSFVLAPIATLAACTIVARQTPPTSERPPTWAHAGYLVVVNQADSTADLIDLQQGKSIKKIPTGLGPHEAAISDDGRLVVVTNYGNGPRPGNSLTLAKIPSGEVIKTVDLGTYTRPHGVAWLDADRVLVTSETTRNVVQVNVTEGKVEKTFATGNGGSHMLALDRAGGRVYTANVSGGNVTAIDLKSEQRIGDAPAAEASEGIAVSPDGKWIATGNRSGSISILDAKAMEKKRDIECPGIPYRAAFTPDSRRALIPCPQSREFVVVDVAKLEILKKISTSADPSDPSAPLAGPRGVFVHPDGKWAYLTLNESSSAAVVDLQKLEVVGRIPVGGSPDGIAYGKPPKS